MKRHEWMTVMAIAFTAACAPRGVIADAEPVSPREPVTLEVRNHNWSDVVVYAVRGTQRVRLMTVVATHVGTVVVPEQMIGPGGELRFHARPIAGKSRVTSDRIYASPGTMVSWTLESDLRRSSVSVW